MKPAERINCVSEYYFSRKLAEVKQLQQNGQDIINLGIGSPDLPPHSDVLKELAESSSYNASNKYQPYNGIEELRIAWSDWYSKTYNIELNPSNEILPLMGSKEGIMHISMAFCNPNDQVLVPNPGYPTYSSVSKLLNLNVANYNLTVENDWIPDKKELEQLANSNCKILWINNPHMPTGKSLNEDKIRDLVLWAKSKDILIVNDNPYSLILNNNPTSILSFKEVYDNILELNSLSKSHNMAGWRVGMIGGSEENIKHIIKVKSNFDSGMYKPVQLAAIKALQLDDNWVINLNREYKSRQQMVFKMLDSLECGYKTNTSGLFVWAQIPNEYSNSFEFSDYLLYELGIFATPGEVFGSNGKKFIRFSLCASKENLRDALLKVISIKQNVLCE